MIIVSIAGGLGNQMFMYAAGLSVATRLNTELLLGLQEFNISPNHERPYLLGNFPNITERTASFWDYWKIYPGLALINTIGYKPIRRRNILRLLVREIVNKFRIYGGLGNYSRFMANRDLMSRKYPKLRMTEPGGYSSNFESIPDGVMLSGYWSSEKFFATIKDEVRRKFTFPQECFNPEISAKIRACNSVALHVRRGDKVRYQDFYFSDEQLLRAELEKISSLTEDPVFFVFSDDIEWCRKNLPHIHEGEYHFIESESKNPLHDMALMTICRHVIMGPSTFSWWGAWLNNNPGKIIIAPSIKRWKLNSEMPSSMYPENWIKIE